MYSPGDSLQPEFGELDSYLDGVGLTGLALTEELTFALVDLVGRRITRLGLDQVGHHMYEESMTSDYASAIYLDPDDLKLPGLTLGRSWFAIRGRPADSRFRKSPEKESGMDFGVVLRIQSRGEETRRGIVCQAKCLRPPNDCLPDDIRDDLMCKCSRMEGIVAPPNRLAAVYLAEDPWIKVDQCAAVRPGECIPSDMAVPMTEILRRLARAEIGDGNLQGVYAE